MEEIRLNKYLSEKGICSRREADRLISEGKVSVNGIKAGMGQKVTEECKIEIEGRDLSKVSNNDPVVIIYNKPKGVVCTDSSKDRAPNIIDCINYGSHIFPIGRLDKDSEGLILLTNIGELVNRINKGSYGHEKEYIVSCRRPVTDAMLSKLAGGMVIEVPVGKKSGDSIKKVFEKRNTRPCKVKRLDSHSFCIILTQGFNRQIRRMCAAVGNEVIKLKRVRIMNIELGELETGRYRKADVAELKVMFKKLGMVMPELLK